MRRLRARRWYWRRRGDLPERLARAWSQPLPRARDPVQDIRFLVCDAEMTGLDPKRDELLSLAWVGVESLEIDLGSAHHLLLKSDRGVGSSATIHGLRDCELETGMPPIKALEALVAAADRRVLVFHHASLDRAFLDAVSQRYWGLPLLLPAIDTQRIEETLLRRSADVLPENALRLPACRARYGLGPHRSHSALGDAIATAELMLAQIARRGTGLRFRDLA